MPHPQVRDRLAADLAPVQFLDMSAHGAQHLEQPGSGGIEADILDHEIAAGHDQRGDHEEGGGRRIARHDDVLRLQIRFAVQRDYPFAIFLLNGKIGTEAAQHPLRMVARRHRLDHAGGPGDVEARQQQCAFHLCAGHRQAIGNRDRGVEAAQRQRQSASLARLDLRADLRQWLDHAAHRAFRQAGIANKGRGDRMAGNKAHQEPRRGARIAHVERFGRLQQAANAHAMDAPNSVSLALDGRAHLAHRLRGGEHVLALQQAGNARFAHGQRAEHDRTVADRLVAGHADTSGQRTARGEAARRRGGRGMAGHGGGLLTAARACGKARAFDSRYDIQP